MDAKETDDDRDRRRRKWAEYREEEEEEEGRGSPPKADEARGGVGGGTYYSVDTDHLRQPPSSFVCSKCGGPTDRGGHSLSSLSESYPPKTPPTPAEGHSKHCICRGTGLIVSGVSSERGLGPQFGDQGLGGEWKETCPYGYLKMNQKQPEVPHEPTRDDEWDI